MDALRVSSPFFDPRGAALRALVDRFSPAALDVALQPALSQYDAAALARVAATVPAAGFRLLDESRTYHGKLVEWSVDGATTALVGSANCTAAALLSNTATGGNCELVALAPVPDSLLPEGTAATAVPPSEAHAVTTQPRRAVELILLGARRREPDLVVVLTPTARGPGTIESTPGTWMAFHVWRPTGETSATLRFPAPEQLGGAVRAWVEVSGERVMSSPVYLTDPVRCLPREDEQDRPRLVHAYELDKTITDPTLAARFSADLLRLLSQVSQRPPTGTSPLRTQHAGVEVASSEDRWGAWLHHVEGMLGPSLTGLVFPSSLRLPDGTATGWTVEADPDDRELSEDEDVVDIEDAPAPTRPAIPPSQHRNLRTWATRWVKAVSRPARPPLELRMTVVLLYLDLLAAGVWGTEESWRTEVRDLVHALLPDDEETDALPGHAISYQCSLTAVCLALLFQDASPHGGGERDVIAKTAWEVARESVAFADRRLAVEYLHRPAQPHARVVSETEVDEVIELAEAVVDDPQAELRAAFAQAGLPARLMGGVWVVDGEFRNPRRTAAHAASVAG
ncbi:hypothetical protein K7G98_25960, partial [Saccharothrix sp. MB29]|nr:hypothetical protein [Saccharothrix sp. MB29]